MVERKQAQKKARNIKLLIMDVDGVLTSGLVNIFGDGQEMYTFNVYDGYGIILWRRAGFKAGFMTGRNSDAVASRAKKLGVDFLLRAASDKLALCEELAREEGLEMKEIAFIGDDLQDLALLKSVGLAMSPANVRPEVRKHIDYISPLNGGDAAVRDCIEFILKSKNLWKDITNQKRILS
ncbi:HAD hydrolase family protein [Candidatus Parcubacteria bacterium]|nr:HAD hydrolase family protein [Candidatus Parcubacteria bacterium]